MSFGFGIGDTVTSLKLLIRLYNVVNEGETGHQEKYARLKMFKEELEKSSIQGHRRVHAQERVEWIETICAQYQRKLTGPRWQQLLAKIRWGFLKSEKVEKELALLDEQLTSWSRLHSELLNRSSDLYFGKDDLVQHIFLDRFLRGHTEIPQLYSQTLKNVRYQALKRCFGFEFAKHLDLNSKDAADYLEIRDKANNLISETDWTAAVEKGINLRCFPVLQLPIFPGSYPAGNYCPVCREYCGATSNLGPEDADGVTSYNSYYCNNCKWTYTVCLTKRAHANAGNARRFQRQLSSPSLVYQLRQDHVPDIHPVFIFQETDPVEFVRRSETWGKLKHEGIPPSISDMMYLMDWIKSTFSSHTLQGLVSLLKKPESVDPSRSSEVILSVAGAFDHHRDPCGPWTSAWHFLKSYTIQDVLSTLTLSNDEDGRGYELYFKWLLRGS